MVLNHLQWNISTVNPLDFVDHLLIQSKILNLTESQLDQIKEKIENILVLAVTNYEFSYLNPSLLAGSAIHLVLSRIIQENPKIQESIKSIAKSIKSTVSDIQRCSTQLEECVPNYLLRLTEISAEMNTESQISKSHSDYGSSISSSAEDLPNEMNDSCILVS